MVVYGQVKHYEGRLGLVLGLVLLEDMPKAFCCCKYGTLTFVLVDITIIACPVGQMILYMTTMCVPPPATLPVYWHMENICEALNTFSSQLLIVVLKLNH